VCIWARFEGNCQWMRLLHVTLDTFLTLAPQKHMAGHPPASLQRLFHMGRKLKDSEALGPLVEDTPLALPVILDMAPPIE